ncbi:MAG: MerR family transcriptional regulator [Oscillospiraceae bacterium]|nr:MerR family transcriptional regulator [Oscillospiraceae bacterium]
MGKGNIYSTHQIAKHSGVCANTVRNYEKYGFISKSKRARNGYRIFTDVHKLQMTICRLIFTPPYINSSIRKASKEVIYAAAKEDFGLCKEQNAKYIKAIENERTKANEAVIALANFCNPKNNKNNDIYYDRKEAAAIIGSTVETIRNWERNGLIFSTKKNNKNVYDKREMDFMRLIYILLIGGFGIEKIYYSFMFLRDSQNEQALEALCDSHDYIDIDNIGKNIIEKMTEVSISAHKIKELLEKNI